jgi:hypothetical protein
MDTSQEAAMVVHCTDGTTMKSVKHSDGLFFFDTFMKSNDLSVGRFLFVSTVTQNKSVFVTREIETADKARELYRKLGRPSQKKLEDVIANNIVANCPVTMDDARRAILIYGPNIAALNGKTTQGQASTRIPNFVATKIPAPFYCITRR